KDKPVNVLFHISADNKVLDASVEDAPTRDMAEAALRGTQRFTFSPQTIDGKPTGNRFYYFIWFTYNSGSSTVPMDERTGSGIGEAGRSITYPGPESGSVYINDEPSFVFHYPSGF